MHTLRFVAETENDIQFRCVDCLQLIGFNREGVGEPCARLIDGQWTPPDDAGNYLNPCELIPPPTEEQDSIDPVTQSNQFRTPDA